MKKIYFLILSALLLCTSNAQNSSKEEIRQLLKDATIRNFRNFNYTLSTLSGSYTNLTGATSLNSGQIWDDPSYVIPVSFPFTANGTTISSLQFGGLGGALLWEIGTTGVYEIILPFDTDLIDRGYALGNSLSPLSYKVDGSAGNRILKIEWNNVGSYDEGSPYSMYINFQLWLYETSNIIEIRFGPSMINNPNDFYYLETGAYMGILTFDGNLSELSNEHFLTGSVASPVLSTNLEAINGTPTNGTIYRLTPGSTPTSIGEISTLHEVVLYPNPVNDFVTISNLKHPAEVTVINSIGAVVKHNILNAQNNILDIRELASGIYFVAVNSNGEIKTLKFVKD